MIGAIVGDIIGSRFELKNHRSKDFELFTNECHPTDDSIMTVAVMDCILKSNGDINKLSDCIIKSMQYFGRKYPNCGFGKAFKKWVFSDNPEPYNSKGNGSAMRISPVGFCAKDKNQVISMSEIITKVSHNHNEGIKGAEAVAVAIYMAKHGTDLYSLCDYMHSTYYQKTAPLSDLRKIYKFDSSCEGTIPQCITVLSESNGFEDTIRNAISIGGDSDTIAAICGSIADAYYGIPEHIEQRARQYLTREMLEIIDKFQSIFA